MLRHQTVTFVSGLGIPHEHMSTTCKVVITQIPESSLDVEYSALTYLERHELIKYDLSWIVFMTRLAWWLWSQTSPFSYFVEWLQDEFVCYLIVLCSAYNSIPSKCYWLQGHFLDYVSFEKSNSSYCTCVRNCNSFWCKSFTFDISSKFWSYRFFQC